MGINYSMMAKNQDWLERVCPVMVITELGKKPFTFDLVHGYWTFSLISITPALLVSFVIKHQHFSL